MPTIRRKLSTLVRDALRGHRPTVLILCTTVFLACQSPERNEPIAYGVDRCAECSRVIAQPRHAAQYRSADGTRRIFDDPGCLFRGLRKENGSSIRFQDHEHERWLGPDDIWFVHTGHSPTPAGYGWIALGTFSAAQDAVTSAGSGEVLRFDEAKKKVATEK